MNRSLERITRNPERITRNPEHLEQTTVEENIRRGVVLTANRERCMSGRHVIAEVGIYVDSAGSERCRECRLESKRRYRAKIAA